MRLYIKNMVCIRCKMIVKQILIELKVNYLVVELGNVDTIEDITILQKEVFNAHLKSYGLELMDDKKSCLVEKIKILIVEFVHYSDEPLKMNFSQYLSEKLHYDYTYLANIFSQTESITIEHCLIVHKIEKIKEMLIYDQLSIKEISFKLQYSSVAHLSNQFKKITGLCPSQFKYLRDNHHLGLAGLNQLSLPLFSRDERNKKEKFLIQ
jgi:AraC-like DNA-binding protein